MKRELQLLVFRSRFLAVEQAIDPTAFAVCTRTRYWFQHGWHSGIPLAPTTRNGSGKQLVGVEWRTSAQVTSSRGVRVCSGWTKNLDPATSCGNRLRFGGTLANVSDNVVAEQVHFGELRGLSEPR